VSNFALSRSKGPFLTGLNGSETFEMGPQKNNMSTIFRDLNFHQLSDFYIKELEVQVNGQNKKVIKKKNSPFEVNEYDQMKVKSWCTHGRRQRGCRGAVAIPLDFHIWYKYSR